MFEETRIPTFCHLSIKRNCPLLKYVRRAHLQGLLSKNHTTTNHSISPISTHHAGSSFLVRLGTETDMVPVSFLTRASPQPI